MVVAIGGCSSTPVTPLRGQDGNTVRRDRYWCTQTTKQQATVRTPSVASEADIAAGTALGVLVTLGGIALAVVGAPFGDPFTGINIAVNGLTGGSGDTTTIDPDLERIAYANCMEARGYGVAGAATAESTTPPGAGSK
jgi:hypothetical protein